MGGHGGQTALISAKIVIVRVTNRRVHFDMLPLMKNVSVKISWVARKGKIKSYSKRECIDLQF